MVLLRNLLAKLALYQPLNLITIVLTSSLVAVLDGIIPQDVPTDALYALPIWLGLLSWGLPGGIGVATSSIILFYISNYLISGSRATNLWPTLGLNYGLFLLFSYGAYRFLLDQRQLKQTRSDLLARLVELDQLYQRSQELHQQSLKLAVTEERNRLAREIHDVLAQGLTAIILQVEAAYVSRNDPVAVAKRLAQINELAHHNLQEARRSVANLRPLPLDGSSLLEALEHKVAEFKAEAAIEAVFTYSGQVQALPAEVEAALYRITQEALTNVARHAEASQVQVMLDYDEDELCLTVQDNGRGFDLNAKTAQLKIASPQNQNQSKTYGLSSMHERARLIGGWVTFQSRSGEGCRIRVIVPYLKAREWEVGRTEAPGLEQVQV